MNVGRCVSTLKRSDLYTDTFGKGVSFSNTKPSFRSIEVEIREFLPV